MFSSKSVLVVLGTSLICVAVGLSQQTPYAGVQTPQSIHVNVVVASASGQCVTDLQRQDFTIFDNNSVRSITSFKVVTISPKPIEGSGSIDAAAGTKTDAGCYQRGELFQYEITFDAPTAERPNEYHRVEVKVDKPNLTVRSRNGYYAQP